MHQHAIRIEGQYFTFLARGSRKWAYKGDSVSFDWELVDGKYKNVVKATFRALDKNGRPVRRGDRTFKSQIRSAPVRMPGK